MSLRFLVDEPAVLIQEKKILVISDLHLGYEIELYENGIMIPTQFQRFRDQIEKLKEETKATTLVILGDLKHKVPGIKFREIREIPKFLEFLKENFKVLLIKGNHDTEIETILPKGIKLYPASGFSIGKYGFFHGSSWPHSRLISCDFVFMGHLHPVVEFRDDIGFRNIERIWVKSKLDTKKIQEKYKIKKLGELNLIIVPAFNRLMGGLALNRSKPRDLLGPLLSSRIIDIDESEAFLLDGTELGKIGSL